MVQIEQGLLGTPSSAVRSLASRGFGADLRYFQQPERAVDTSVKEFPMPLDEFSHLAAGIQTDLQGLLLAYLSVNGHASLRNLRLALETYREQGDNQQIIPSSMLNNQLVSLARFGLVNRDEASSEANTYVIAPYGRTMGLAYAGFGRTLSQAVGKTPTEIWGDHQPSPGKARILETPDGVINVKQRQAETRYKVYKTIMEERRSRKVKKDKSLVLRQGPLAQRVGVKHSTLDIHLRKLADAGVINYGTLIDDPDGLHNFAPADKMPEEDPPAYHDQPWLTNEVLMYAIEKGQEGPLTRRGAREFLQAEFKGRDQRDPENLEEVAGDIMAYLAKLGYLKRRFSVREQSEIVVDPDQLAQISTIMQATTDFRLRDLRGMQAYRVAGLQVLQDRKLVAEIIEQAIQKAA